jgi:hypothetical protein
MWFAGYSSVDVIVMDKKGKEAAPRVFLSYSNADKEVAGSLKKYLEYFEIEAFLAHEDIEPGEKWTKVILRELASCDLFVPITTRGARDSLYVNQEIGYALALNKDILPFRLDSDPFGFISETQGMTPPKTWRNTGSGAVKVTDYAESASVIAERMMRQPTLAASLRKCAIDGLLDSKSWEETNCKIRLLDKIGEMTQDEVDKIAKAAIENNQVYDSFAARDYLLKKFLANHSDRLTEPTKKKIKARVS